MTERETWLLTIAGREYKWDDLTQEGKIWLMKMLFR